MAASKLHLFSLYFILLPSNESELNESKPGFQRGGSLFTPRKVAAPGD